jgi:hypothetical protein
MAIKFEPKSAADRAAKPEKPAPVRPVTPAEPAGQPTTTPELPFGSAASKRRPKRNGPEAAG